MRIPLLRDKDSYILKVIVKTGARTSEIEVKDGDILELKLRAQPHDGLANKELIEMLSEALNVPKSKIEIRRGKTSRHKIIRIKEK